MNSVNTSYRIPTDGTFKANALQHMNLVNQIEIKLAGKEHPVALGFKKMLADGHPAAAILKDIREMAISNTSFIASMIGNELTVKLIDHD